MMLEVYCRVERKVVVWSQGRQRDTEREKQYALEWKSWEDDRISHQTSPAFGSSTRIIRWRERAMTQKVSIIRI